MTSEAIDPDRPPRHRRKQALGVLAVVASGLLVTLVVSQVRRTSDGQPQRAAPATNQDGPSVQLTIDFGDGFQKRFPTLAWQSGMTVLDALRAAARHPRGIRLESAGRREMTLITAIDGVANQGGGPNTRNWVYQVNGRRATRGCAVVELQPGDRVLWELTFYD